jgi:hypothetical protein
MDEHTEQCIEGFHAALYINKLRGAVYQLQMLIRADDPLRDVAAAIWAEFPYLSVPVRHRWINHAWKNIDSKRKNDPYQIWRRVRNTDPKTIAADFDRENWSEPRVIRNMRQENLGFPTAKKVVRVTWDAHNVEGDQHVDMISESCNETTTHIRAIPKDGYCWIRPVLLSINSLNSKTPCSKAGVMESSKKEAFTAETIKLLNQEATEEAKRAREALSKDPEIMKSFKDVRYGTDWIVPARGYMSYTFHDAIKVREKWIKPLQEEADLREIITIYGGAAHIIDRVIDEINGDRTQIEAVIKRINEEPPDVRKIDNQRELRKKK